MTVSKYILVLFLIKGNVFSVEGDVFLVLHRQLFQCIILESKSFFNRY